jgi:threonylcarbamoyladenosine tRNA methylthiotransferase MtaB
MHIFPYSQRKNTLASTFKNLVSDNEKHWRFEIINDLKTQNKIEYLKKFINKKVHVLFEKSDDSNFQVGHSEYFFKVKVKTNKIFTNELLEVTIDKIYKDQLLGSIDN